VENELEHLRTELGREVITRMIKAGVIEVKPAEEDPAAIVLMDRLSRVSRNRWPETAIGFPKRMPPPPKKKKPKPPTKPPSPPSPTSASPCTASNSSPTPNSSSAPDQRPRCGRA